MAQAAGEAPGASAGNAAAAAQRPAAAYVDAPTALAQAPANWWVCKGTHSCCNLDAH